MTKKPRQQSSPRSPTGTTSPVAGWIILTSTWGEGRPTVVDFRSNVSVGSVCVMTPVASVWPKTITISVPIRSLTCSIAQCVVNRRILRRQGSLGQAGRAGGIHQDSRVGRPDRSLPPGELGVAHLCASRHHLAQEHGPPALLCEQASRGYSHQAHIS